MADEEPKKRGRGRAPKAETKVATEAPKAEKRKASPVKEEGAAPAKRSRGRPKGSARKKSRGKGKAKAKKTGGTGKGRGRPAKKAAEDKGQSSGGEEPGSE